MDPILKQKIEELDGSRRGNKARSAVRIEDMRGVLNLPPSLQAAEAAGSTPTKAEFDALVKDVHEMHRRFLAVVAALQARLGR